MRVGFDSPEAHLLNSQIFATIYYASMEASMNISKNRNIALNRIRELRELYHPEYIKYTQTAKSHYMENDIYKWKTGAGEFRTTNEELKLLEKEHLPIDEELYILDNNGNFIDNDILLSINKYCLRENFAVLVIAFFTILVKWVLFF